MSKIKYHVIAVDDCRTIEENNNNFLQLIVKYVLCILMTLTIVYYAWDPAKDKLESTTLSFPTPFKDDSDLQRATNMVESLERSRNSSDIVLENSDPVIVQHNISGLIEKGNDSSVDLQTEESTTNYMKYTPDEFTRAPDVNCSDGSVTDQTDLNIESYLENYLQENTLNASYPLETDTNVKYFVNSPQCKMLQPDPFAKNIMKIYNRKYYTVCDHSPDMITVNFNVTDSTYSLNKNERGASCCYKQIVRAGKRTEADKHYT